MKNNFKIYIAYLDFAKAFDKVSHNRLLIKLRAYGITGQLLNWYEDFIKGRQQRVVIGSNASSWLNIDSGVIQGSVLGPILFIIYT